MLLVILQVLLLVFATWFLLWRKHRNQKMPALPDDFDAPDEYNCPVCFEMFGSGELEPRVLLCGHTLCNGCIERVPTDTSFKVTCPMCQQEKEYAGDIPVNYGIKSACARFANQIKCGECRKPKDEVRVCPAHKYKTVCAMCIIDKHRNCDLISLQEYKAIKLRLDAVEELDKMGGQITVAKNNLRRKIDMLKNIAENLEEQWRNTEIPAQFYNTARGIKTETDSKGLMELADDLRHTFLGSMNKFSDILDKAVEEGRNQLAVTNDAGSEDSIGPVRVARDSEPDDEEAQFLKDLQRAEELSLMTA